MCPVAAEELPIPLQSLAPHWNELLNKAFNRLIDEFLSQLIALDGGQEDDEKLLEQILPVRSQLLTDWDYELDRMWKNIRLRPKGRSLSLDMSADTMQLVNTEDMEEEVRVKSLALRIRHMVGDILPSWRERLLQVYSWKQWPDVPLPYDPEFLILLMRRLLLRTTSWGSQQRIRWLQAFVVGVLEELPGLLVHAGEQLQEAGFGTEVVRSTPMPGSPVQVQLPEVLERLAKSTGATLLGLFEAFFQALPSAFHEYMCTATEAEQERVMALLQQIQRSLDTARELYVGHYQQLYYTMLKPASLQQGEALGLVDESGMHWSLQKQAVAQRCRKQQIRALQALQMRFAHVLKKIAISERNLPLDPAQLLNILDPVLSAWPLTEEDRYHCLLTYEKLFLGDVALVLDEANEFLVLEGVLVQLPHSKIMKAQDKPVQRVNTEKPVGAKAAPATGGGRAGGGGSSMSDEELTWLRGLMRSPDGQFQSIVVNNRTIGASVEAVSINPQHIPEGVEVTTLPTRDLLAILNQLQRQTSVVSVVEDAQSPSVREVRGSLKSELQQDGDAVQLVRTTDEDVINLISMIFDFILDDQALPMPMKALLGRLQIPLLKVAMLDAHFFDPEEHPARALLNLLAKAGMGWSQNAEGSEDLYQHIERVVFRIMREFNEDIDLFKELLQEFSEYYDRFSQRQELIEKRTREAEEGRARAEVARAMTVQTINRRLQGTKVPKVLVELLQEGWHQILYVTCLREGVESDAWKQVVKVMDALIWSVLERKEDTWRQQLASLGPKILLNVRKGLKGTATDPAKTEHWLHELGGIHEHLLRQIPVERLQVVVSEPGSPVVPAQPGSAQLSLPAAQVPQPTPEPGAQSDQVAQIVAALPIGAWVERMDRQPVDRCKLVARIRIVDKMVFTNRRGIKEIELSSAALAEKVRSGHWRLLDRNEQIFDRALETVLNGLRQRKPEAA